MDWSAVCDCVCKSSSHIPYANSEGSDELTHLRTLVRAVGVRIALAVFLMPCVLWLNLAVPWIGLLFVIVVFLDHTHMLFCVRSGILYMR